MEVISIGDLLKMAPDKLAARDKKQRESWEEPGRCRHGNIRIEDDWILIEVVTEYHIKLDRIDEPWKLDRWTEHLRRKPWMSLEDLLKFQRLVINYFGKSFVNRTTPPHPNFLP